MSFKRSVLPPVVIQLKELSESDVDVVMLDRSPEVFDKDIVQRSAFSIHADRDAVGCKNASEFRAGELAALIRIEYFRIAMLLQSLLQGFDTKAGASVVERRQARIKRLYQSTMVVIPFIHMI